MFWTKCILKMVAPPRWRYRVGDKINKIIHSGDTLIYCFNIPLMSQSMDLWRRSCKMFSKSFQESMQNKGILILSLPLFFVLIQICEHIIPLSAGLQGLMDNIELTTNFDRSML